MKTKWKWKLLPLLLALALILPSCSPQSDTEDKSSESSQTAVVTEQPAEKPTEIPEDTVTPSPTEAPAETLTPMPGVTEAPTPTATPEPVPSVSLSDIPAYSGEPYVVLNNNIPGFQESEFTTASFETYSDLDALGRCGVAYANIGQDLMPTEERGSIGQVRPSGWHTVKYDCVDGKYLYNRCHLIGYQLTAENANTKNLITGTRYLNTEGMLPFENMVADYIKETGNHVLYRVTPIFEGDNLVASGVQMEAESVEDRGEGILFNIYCYNVQPGVTIDYSTGDSQLSGGAPSVETPAPTEAPEQPEDSGQVSASTYILNTNSHKFHYPDCSSVGQMSEKNKAEFSGSRDELIQQGYEPCKRCNP
jgi:DNA-entry nuclease